MENTMNNVRMAELVTARTEIGELKLVIEQQDRDLAAARDMNRHYEQERDSWLAAYRQRAQKTDAAIAALRNALREALSMVTLSPDLEEQNDRLHKLVESGSPCTEATK